jgi:poly-gamma-glutamate synthesis protein (capsule biosynthesis protein)
MCPLLLLGDLAPVDIWAVSAEPMSSGGLILANLETPLCDETLIPRPKAGPTLRGDSQVLRSLASTFPGLVVSLANNHMMDYGRAGVIETLEACEQAGVPCFGAGENLAKASAELRLDIGGLQVALVGVCERQFGFATTSQPGVARLSTAIFDRIRVLRMQVDRVIVSVHGGAEMSAWPAPHWQETLRALAAAGAHVVHGHHPHIPQGFESWAGGWVFYGAGNSIVNPSFWAQPSAALRSWRFELDLHDLSRPPHVSMWGVFSPRHGTVELRSIPMDADLLDACNTPLSDPVLLEGVWQEYATSLWQSFYEPALKPGLQATECATGIIRGMRSTLHAIAAPATWRAKCADRHRLLYHLFACEHHSEAIATAIALNCQEIPDHRTEKTRRIFALVSS